MKDKKKPTQKCEHKRTKYYSNPHTARGTKLKLCEDCLKTAEVFKDGKIEWGGE